MEPKQFTFFAMRMVVATGEFVSCGLAIGQSSSHHVTSSGIGTTVAWTMLVTGYVLVGCFTGGKKTRPQEI